MFAPFKRSSFSPGRVCHVAPVLLWESKLTPLGTFREIYGYLLWDKVNVRLQNSCVRLERHTFLKLRSSVTLYLLFIIQNSTTHVIWSPFDTEWALASLWPLAKFGPESNFHPK